MNKDEEKSAFATRLEEEMRRSGIADRASLARATGIPYHRLNPWFIRPKAKPNASDMLALSQALNVSETYLLHGGERSPRDRLDQLLVRVEALGAEAQDELESYLDYLEQKNSRARSDQEQR